MKYDMGLAVRKAQEARGISNKKMQEDYGVFKQQVYRWQTSQDMRLSKIEEFAEYFGYTVTGFINLGKQ